MGTGRLEAPCGPPPSQLGRVQLRIPVHYTELQIISGSGHLSQGARHTSCLTLDRAKILFTKLVS